MLILSQFLSMHFIRGFHIGLTHFLVYDPLFEDRKCDIAYMLMIEPHLGSVLLYANNQN